jgi:hypothetical protein
MKFSAVPRFRIDPNRARGDCITTSLHRAETPFVVTPEPGDWVEVVDDEGNVLDARVESLQNGRLELCIKWETLTPPVVFEPRPRVGVQASPGFYQTSDAIDVEEAVG